MSKSTNKLQSSARSTLLDFSDFWSQRYATPDQYFLTKHISQRLGSVIAYWACRVGISANKVTLLGLMFMISASLCLGQYPQGPAYAYVALVLYQIGFALDCADGQIARATHTTSEFGAWLDNACDYVRYITMLLALGAVLLSSGLSLVLITVALFLLGSGLIVNLHTVYTLKGGHYRSHGLSGFRGSLKYWARSVSDTPFVLLLICLLAPLPLVMSVYIAIIGLVNLVQAVALGLLRIRKPQEC